MNGRLSDGGAIKNTVFYQMLCANKLKIPAPRAPENYSTNFPFVFIEDEAFALRKNLMKPFPQKDLNHDRKIFNYRLSRARRVVENVFGILWSRFRIFNVPINMKLENIDSVVMGCCVLHFLYKTKGNRYITTEGVTSNNEQVASMPGLQGSHNRHFADNAKEVHELYLQYFNTVGAVEWQENKI